MKARLANFLRAAAVFAAFGALAALILYGIFGNGYVALGIAIAVLFLWGLVPNPRDKQ